MRLSKISIFNVINDHLIDYPTPSNLNYFWGFGSLAGIALAIQIVTGIFLAMHYCPHIDYAFYSVEHIMRDVNYGWLIRFIHSNGASFFFIFVYLHIARGLYFGSYIYPRGLLWISGVIIFILMILTAFLGYVLPWGQMSFWGATVITNLFSAVPYIGNSIAEWLWGGFSVDNATLNRFFSLHYLLPFIILSLVLVHLILLHLNGSTNPLGINKTIDKISFYPYFYVKDLIGLIFMMCIFLAFIFYIPNFLGHPDNYIEANSMVTPTHIVPEWYLLPFYAILRSIPSKLGGVICMGLALIVLMFIPYLNTSLIRSSKHRILFRLFYWIFIVDVVVLGWIGAQPVEAPYVLIGQLATLYYFLFFLVLIPVLGLFEKWIFMRCSNNNFEPYYFNGEAIVEELRRVTYRKRPIERPLQEIFKSILRGRLHLRKHRPFYFSRIDKWPLPPYIRKVFLYLIKNNLVDLNSIYTSDDKYKVIYLKYFKRNVAKSRVSEVLKRFKRGKIKFFY